MSDKETLSVYAREANRYAKQFSPSQDTEHMRAFLAGLPQGARLLDLGCGPGNAAAFMADCGYSVDAWDASPEMVELARDRHGLETRIARFDDLTAIAEYDGVYANFSLLHAPRSEMPAHLGRIATALKPGGRVHIGLKTGQGEKRDSLGRFYAYFEDHELTALLEGAGFSIQYRRTGKDAGLDGTVAPWIILQGLKND
jgi:SAM-dependent methyltransferase